MRLPLFEQLSLFRVPTPQVEPGKLQHIQIGARIVAYRLMRRRQRRNLGLTIDERGLTVGAPIHTPLAEIEAFIRNNADWVNSKLEQHAGSHRKRHIAVRDGTRIPYLGGEAEVHLIAGANRVRWDGERMIIAAKLDADIDALARRALQRQALALFGERLAIYATRLGRHPPALGLSSARTRWGSCSEKSGIRLNWRLIHAPLRLIDYVVAHELAHLVEMNHSRRFWAEVARIFPDWKDARRDLKALAGELPII
jgi:predicted metal-dependent hydrolase